MTIKLEITGVQTTGDGVRITGQGKRADAPDYSSIDEMSFVVPTWLSHSYYVGRIVTLKVQP